MKCSSHHRDAVGSCMWCGSQLCVMCIAKEEGKKLYCEKCVSLLGTIKR